MNDTVKWVRNNQLLLSYVSCFFLFSFLFGILWAIVLLVTLELIEDNFQIDIFSKAEQDQESLEEEEKIYFRKYNFSNSANNITEMYSRDDKHSYKNGNMNSSKNPGELRPSLSSLIHRSGRSNKENVNKDSQPLLAVVKNNMHLRKHVHQVNQSPKSPLYKNMIIPTQRRRSSITFSNFSSPSSGLLVHQSSGWCSPSQNANNTSTNSIQSPSVALNKSVYDQYNNGDLNNKSVTGTIGLEVHGSYFLNKSLLHSNLVKEEQNFSLVNSNFRSPNLRRVDSMEKNDTSQRKNSKQPVYDETSTEAVISMLKEKSKRKRQSEDATPSDTEPVLKYRKRVKMNDNFDDTLNELFPPVSSAGPRKRASITVTKKRLSTVGTQYEPMEKTETSPMKKACINRSPGRGKIGLTEEQTDELMVEEEHNTQLKDAMDSSTMKQSIESEELEKAVNHVKKSLAKYKESSKQKVTFSLDKSNSQDAFSTPIKLTDENGEDETKNKYSILKSLKSPYKKIFHSTFPSNLTPGSAEKRRKHPVYFTAKIDIDEIQSSREEYGERGASLKAFRLDQEEAKERVNSLLDEAEEVDFKVKGTTTLSSSTIISTSIFSSTVTSSTAQQVSAGSGLLSALKKIATTPSITFGTATVATTTAATSAASKNVTFNFPTAVSSAVASASSGLPGFSFSTSNTTTSGVSVPLPVTSFSGPPSTTTASTAVSSSALPGFSFGLTNAASSASGLPTLSTAQPSQSFSFGNSSSSSATVTTNSFNVNISNTKPVSGPQPSNGQLPAPSFNFGAPKVTGTSTAPSSQFSFPSSGTAKSTIETQPVGGKPLSFQFAAQSSSATSTAGSQAAGATNIFNSSAPSTNVLINNIPQTVTSSSSASQFSFGQTPATNVFGVPSSTATTSAAPSVFGSQTAPTQPQAGNIFGPSTTAATNVFAASAPATSSSIFGSGNPPPAYGASSTQQPATAAGFGAKPSSNFSFNAPSTTTATNSGGITGFNFGSKPSVSAGNVFGGIGQVSTQAQIPASSSSSVFGTAHSQNVFQAPTSVSSASSSNIFGAAPATANSGNVFGNSTGNTGSVFVQQPQSNTATAAGGGFQFGASAPRSFGSTASTKSGFSFGANTTSTATNSVFGQPTTSTSSIFRQPSSAASVFGQPTTSASVFGQPTQSTSSVFGQSTATSASVFGQPAASSTSVFGQPAGSGSVFGQPVATSASVFGQPSNTSNVFGSAPSTSAAPSIFGASNTNSNVAPTPFGSNPASTSVFGNTNNTVQPNPFQPAANKSGFDFSASLKQGPSLAFGGSSSGTAFGSQPATPAKPTFNFGNKPAVPSFGTPSTPVFGAQQSSTFGTPQQSAPFGSTPSVFNSPATPSGGFTIGQGTSNPPRVTQRARRRLKK